MAGHTDTKLTLEQLIAVNDELVALSRAGVPIEHGLAQLGPELPGKLGAITSAVARRLSAGESLAHVVSQSTDVPASFAAVIESGIRAGNLTRALEGIAHSARIVQDVKRTLLLSLIYPLIVLVVGYCLFLFLVVETMPTLSDSYRYFEVPNLEVIHWLADVGRRFNVFYWFPLAAVLAVFAWWWLRISQPVTATPFQNQWFPTSGTVRRYSQLAVFTDLIALLLEQDTPLDEAMELAGQAVGRGELQTAASAMAARLRRGEVIRSLDEVPRPLPPVLGWLLLSGQRNTQVVKALRSASEGYLTRSHEMASWIAMYVPLLASGVLGGLATLAYALLVLGPLVQAWITLASPGTY